MPDKWAQYARQPAAGGDKWAQYARQTAEPGSSPENPLQEQGVNLEERALLKNYGANTRAAVEYLQRKPGEGGKGDFSLAGIPTAKSNQYDAVEYKPGQIAVRPKGTKDPWKVVDPQTGLFSKDLPADILDLGGDVVNTLSSVVGMVAGASGGLPGAAAGGGVGSAISSGTLGALGESFGLKPTPGERAANIGGEAAAGVIAPLVGPALGKAVRTIPGGGKFLKGVEKAADVPRRLVVRGAENLPGVFSKSIAATTKSLQAERAAAAAKFVENAKALPGLMEKAAVPEEVSGPVRAILSKAQELAGEKILTTGDVSKASELMKRAIAILDTHAETLGMDADKLLNIRTVRDILKEMDRGLTVAEKEFLEKGIDPHGAAMIRAAEAERASPLSPTSVERNKEKVLEAGEFWTRGGEMQTRHIGRTTSKKSKSIAWDDFVKERMGPYMKQYGGHGPAMKKLSEEYQKLPFRQAGEMVEDVVSTVPKFSTYPEIVASYSKMPDAELRALAREKGIPDADVLSRDDLLYQIFDIQSQRIKGKLGRGPPYDPKAHQLRPVISLKKRKDVPRGGSWASTSHRASDMPTEGIVRSFAGLDLLPVDVEAFARGGGAGYLDDLIKAGRVQAGSEGEKWFRNILKTPMDPTERIAMVRQVGAEFAAARPKVDPIEALKNMRPIPEPATNINIRDFPRLGVPGIPRLTKGVEWATNPWTAAAVGFGGAQLPLAAVGLSGMAPGLKTLSLLGGLSVGGKALGKLGRLMDNPGLIAGIAAKPGALGRIGKILLRIYKERGSKAFAAAVKMALSIPEFQEAIGGD